MYYKSDIDKSVNRFKELWAREAKDKILVKIDLQDPLEPTVLMAMRKAPDYVEMVKEWECGFEVNKNIKDDNLPIIYGELGEYIIGGFFGADVRWGTGGAYAEPFLKDIVNYKNVLNFNENNKYYQMQLDYIKYLAKKSKNNFGFTEMIAIDGLNFLDAIRGAHAYTDIYDYPKEVISVLDWASDFNVGLIKNQRKFIKKYKDGRFNFYGIWTPGETIFISVDAYGHCAPEVFERFGRKYVQRLANEFNGGWVHVHSDTIRLVPNYITLKNLIAIGFEDWIKPPRAIENINNILDMTKDIPLMINIEKKELLEMIDSKTLPGNILYWVKGVKEKNEANKIAEVSYHYRAKYKGKYF